MKKPYTLARATLHAYAVMFGLLMLISLPIALSPSIANYIFLLITLGCIVLCEYVARGLLLDRRWARISAYVVFIGLAILTIPLLKFSLSDNSLPEFIWPYIWILIMFCLGILGMITQRHKHNTEHRGSVDSLNARD